MTHPRAIMEIHAGEELVGGWVTPHINGSGLYKPVAKKRRDGKIEWAHFIQRDNGVREPVLNGTVDRAAQLQTVLELANKNLSRTFGAHIQLRTSLLDSRLDSRSLTQCFYYSSAHPLIRQWT